MTVSEFETCRNDPCRRSHGPTDSSALGKIRLVQKPGCIIRVSMFRGDRKALYQPCILTL